MCRERAANKKTKLREETIDSQRYSAHSKIGRFNGTGHLVAIRNFLFVRFQFCSFRWRLQFVSLCCHALQHCARGTLNSVIRRLKLLSSATSTLTTWRHRLGSFVLISTLLASNTRYSPCHLRIPYSFHSFIIIRLRLTRTT